ncbi:hypothetical protein [Rhodanobacter sp. BL-MT-08]
MAFAIGEPVIWPIPPDWGDPLKETLAWLTDVLQGRLGVQQKRQLRLAPRRSFTFLSMMAAQDRRLMDAVRADMGTRPWQLPIWPDLQWTQADLPAGSTVLPCATSGYDFVDGGQALLWRGLNQWELATVQSIGADSLTLTGPTQHDWPALTRLYPTRAAVMNAQPEQDRWSDDGGKVSVSFDIIEPCDWPAAMPASFPLYRGVYVVEWRPNESNDPTDTYDRLIEPVDADTGLVEYIDLPQVPFRNQSHEWLIVGRADHDAFRSLLYALAGRMGTVWLPSWSSDVLLASPVSPADVTLTIEWCGYTVFGRQQPGRRNLRIELWSGAVYYCRITGSVEATDTESLSIDNALGVAFAPSDVRAVSFMTLAELADDSIELDHVTDADGILQVTTAWEAVKDDV